MSESRAFRILLLLALLFLGAAQVARSGLRGEGRDAPAAASDAGGGTASWSVSTGYEEGALEARSGPSLDFLASTTSLSRARSRGLGRIEMDPYFVRLVQGAASRARGQDVRQLEFAILLSAVRTGVHASHTTTPPPLQSV